jgi:hypothetical protein
MMFKIELDSRNEIYKLWSRKLFAIESVAKLVIHIQTAESYFGRNTFREAINQANVMWELIKENGKEMKQSSNQEYYG